MSCKTVAEILECVGGEYVELNESDKQFIDMKLAAEREFKAQLPSNLTKLNFTTCIYKIAPLVLA